MKANVNGLLRWGLLCPLAALVFGFLPTTTVSAVDRAELQRQLGPGGTNWVEPDAAARERAVLVTTQLHDPPANPTGILATDLVRELLCGTIPFGITVANETFNGVALPPYPAAHAGGLFLGGGAPFSPGPIGIPDGVILSTGNIASVVGGPAFPQPPLGGNAWGWNQVSNITTNNRRPGDPDTDAIAFVPTFDAAVLEFDITSVGVNRLLTFKYVFGSEEYDEYAPGSPPPFFFYPDAFGIFIWQNGADPGPGLRADYACIWPFFGPYVPPALPNILRSPVNVITVNRTGIFLNWLFHEDNDCDTRFPGAGYACDPPRETELDGLTQFFGIFAAPPPPYPSPGFPAIPVRSTRFLMTAGATYHVKIAIADAKDRVLDSDVFIKAQVGYGACWSCSARAGFVCDEGLQESDCTDTWSADQLCIDIAPPCPDGACDLFDSGCVETSEVVCQLANGLYMGDGTTCADPEGACCMGNGACLQTTQAFCEQAPLSGTYLGIGTVCGNYGACGASPETCREAASACCPAQDYQGDGTVCEPYGACCTDTGCSLETEVVCVVSLGGVFQGDGNSCGLCGAGRVPIPAVSEWGLVVMVLLVLATGTIIIARRRTLTT